jgi:hypothetical protein
MKKKLLYAVLAFSLATAPSCSDWLDLKPYDGVVEQDYWTTKEDVYLAVMGCYSSLLNPTLVTNIIHWGELRADMVTGSSSASSNVMNVIRGEISPENSIVKWNEFYTTINYCNKVIERAALVKEIDATFSDALYNQYIGEVTTIRSLMYFYLVRSFRNVPLTFQASNSDGQDYYLPNTDEKVIIETLIEQLTTVLSLNALSKCYLPVVYETNDQSKGRITRWTAMTLLADIYLWQGNYAECNRLCTQIMNSGRFSLVPVRRTAVHIYDDRTGLVKDTVYVANQADVARWFDQVYVVGNSPESIFELQYPKNEQSLSDPFFALFNDVRPSIVPNEVALEQIFPESESGNSDVKDIRRAAYNNSLIWKWVGTSASGSSRRSQRQFPHWIVYRYSDVLLMKAEAMNQLSSPTDPYDNPRREALRLVQQVMYRANSIENVKVAPPFNIDDLDQLILLERAREFAFEGKRWYDVLRFAKRDDYKGLNYLTQMAISSAPPEKLASLQVKYEIKQDGNYWFHYWPIYYEEIEMNKNLTQNLFYRR